LLFFGLPGNEPGMMNLPAQIVLDYDNVDLFQQYAVAGAKIEFLVLVTNQYGPNKVSVYGFGSFPEQETAPAQPSEVVAAPEPQPPAQSSETTTPPEPPKPDEQPLERRQRVADLYYRSMALYRAGHLEEARKGLVEVMQSGTIPPAMVQTIKQYIADIDKRLAERTR
jgi:hypothetical protein